ncbi:MAG: hypothetical protein JOY99_00230 [Sphingomonadaceae bacterium]|nr:hypothetical protein [Sphingomonadaceae bacterium]
MRFGSFYEGALSRQERACLTSFVRRGHEITLFSYDPLPVPTGVGTGDAAMILPRDQFFRIESGQHAGNVSQFANRFRYHMIEKTGLTWVDTDLYCLSADWPELPFIAGWQDQFLINNAVLRLPSGHDMLHKAIAATDALHDIPIFGYTGPYLLTALVDQHLVREDVLPRETFYPYHWSQVRELLVTRPDPRAIGWPEGTLAVHLWNEVLRIGGYDKHARPLPNSIMAMLLEEMD